MLGVLAAGVYRQTDRPDDADVLLVNTCAVRDNAEQRVIGRMGELQRFKRPGGVLGGVGCMAQRPPADGERLTDSASRSWQHYEDVPAVRPAGPTQFVTVQRGCDYRCTFCIVP